MSNESSNNYERMLEDIHRDVDFANRYRMEFIKHTMSLAAAVFVFTVSFIKNIVPDAPKFTILIGFGWFFLLFSLFGGLGHMAGWDRYYISYRDHSRDPNAGKSARKKINRMRKVAMWIQLVCFAAGLVLIAVFCLLNL